MTLVQKSLLWKKKSVPFKLVTFIKLFLSLQKTYNTTINQHI